MRNLCLLFFAAMVAGQNSHAGWFEDLYAKSVNAQNTNSYETLVQDIAGRAEIGQSLYADLIARLNTVAHSPPAERSQAIEEIIFYYSQKHEKYKPRATGIEQRLSYTVEELKNGKFDPEAFAVDLVRATMAYEVELVEPVMKQVENNLRQNYRGQIIFNIGRDFTINQIYLKSKRSLPSENIFSLNVSRTIRDLVLGGEAKTLAKLLNSIGITKEMVMNKGIIFLDSSMGGKIPRAILAAFAVDMNAAEIAQMLTRVEIKYVKSKYQPNEVETLAQQAARLAAAGSPKEAYLKLLNKSHGIGIERFALKLPAPYNQWDKDHLHNLIEHRQKFLMTAQRFENGQIMSDRPETNAEYINSSLGLVADVAMIQRLSGSSAPFFKFLEKRKAAPEKNAPQVEDDYKNSPEIKAYFAELDQVSRSGMKAMKQWQGLALPSANQAAAQIAVVKTGKNDYPYELHLDGKRLYRFKKFLSAGNNVQVFLSDRDTAVKVIVDPKNARKQIMQAWMEPILLKRGFQIAAIEWMHPSGMILEQEFIPDESLEYTYSFSNQGLPPKITSQVLAEWQKAKKLAEDLDIWLDVKAANYHVRNGKIIYVDYAPRLNSGYFRYFFVNERTEPLTEAQFLDQFLYHDIRKGNHKKSPQEPNRCEAIIRKAG